MGIWNAVKGALIETAPTEEKISEEIDFTKPLKPTLKPQAPQAPVKLNIDRASESSEPASGEVENISKKLTKVAYGGNASLMVFKTLFDSLKVIPDPDLRIKAALDAAIGQGHSRETISRAIETSGVQLEALEKEFINDLGNSERGEVNARQSRVEQIDAELVRIRQAQQTLEDEKQAALMEITESQRKYAQKRASYEIASKNVADELSSLRISLTKVN